MVLQQVRMGMELAVILAQGLLQLHKTRQYRLALVALQEVPERMRLTVVPAQRLRNHVQGCQCPFGPLEVLQTLW